MIETKDPYDIERRSFEIIESELAGKVIDDINAPVLKRVIHTTADFDYVDNLQFSTGAVANAIEILKKGCCIVTDTNMVKAGINKESLIKGGNEIACFMADADVASSATEQGTTRASISMDKAVSIDKPLIFAIGNAPTALMRLYELIKSGAIKPALIIGVPVGFVNVVESKELIMSVGVPFIVSKGRKGGSNVAAAIVNALLYMAFPRVGI